MPRHMLTDNTWNKIISIMQKTGRVYDKPEHRSTFEGVLYRILTGTPWRDLPSEFGDWSQVYRRFNNWSAKGVLMVILDALKTELDFEWIFIDGSIVKAHQHATGSATKEDEGIGKSVAGNTTKIHFSVDSYGLPINFEITGGEVHDNKMAAQLIEALPPTSYIVCDKGYDSEEIRNRVVNKASPPVIPRKRNSKIGNSDMDWALYKHRHLVENTFARLINYRGIATRFDKLKRNFESVVALGCAIMWIPLNID